MPRRRWKQAGVAVLLVGALAIGFLAFGSIQHGSAGRELAETAESPQPSVDSRELTPKAVVDQPDHDFGVLDPSDACEHEFIVRNEGRAPLKLERGPTTCKCTMSDLPKHPILPGGTARVRVSSKTRNQPGPFSHASTILTNDPQNERLTLQIRGIMRTYLGADPPQLVFSSTRRGETATQQALIYSQVWDAFSIDAVEASSEGLTWKIEPADARELADHGARCGYRVSLSVPSELPGGKFWQWLQVSARAQGSTDSPRLLRLDVTGEVESRCAIYGRHLDGGKMLRLGTVPAGKGAKERLTMKINDEHRQIVVRRLETTPAFLRVKVAPCNEDNTTLGLYRIDVEVPPDAPSGAFMGVKRGEIRIETDHPRLPVLTLGVEFAVVKS